MNPTLLVEPKTKAIAPNIALIKFARFFELKGHEYQYVRGIVYPKIKPDVILMTDYDVKASFFCYLLYNWTDSPTDFWNRIQIAQKIVDDVGETKWNHLDILR